MILKILLSVILRHKFRKKWMFKKKVPRNTDLNLPSMSVSIIKCIKTLICALLFMEMCDDRWFMFSVSVWWVYFRGGPHPWLVLQCSVEFIVFINFAPFFAPWSKLRNARGLPGSRLSFWNPRPELFYLTDPSINTSPFSTLSEPNDLLSQYFQMVE